MRSFLLVLVTTLGVLGPGCTCAGRDPGAATTSETSAPSGEGGTVSAEKAAGVTARLERKRPILRGPLNPSKLRQRPGLVRGLVNGRAAQPSSPDASAAPEAPAAPAASDAPAP